MYSLFMNEHVKKIKSVQLFWLRRSTIFYHSTINKLVNATQKLYIKQKIKTNDKPSFLGKFRFWNVRKIFAGNVVRATASRLRDGCNTTEQKSSLHLQCVRWSVAGERDGAIWDSRCQSGTNDTRASVPTGGVKQFWGKGRVSTKLRMNRDVFCIMKTRTIAWNITFVREETRCDIFVATISLR